MKLFYFLIFLFAGCIPKQQIEFRDIQNIEVHADENGSPLLKAMASFHNPNKVKMVLKEINIEVFIDDKKAALSDQKLDAEIPAKDDFNIPLEIKLSLKEIGLLDTIFGLLSGKKHQAHFVGFVRVKVHGVVIKVPVDYKTELRLTT